MRLHVGTSGYSYDQWEGSFYPEGMKAEDRLAHYGERFGTVEINNTFYRMPKREVVERWAAAVPSTFQFVIKASRRITHQGRLKEQEVSDSVAYLLGQLEPLGEKRGPLLFQTPPYLRKGVDRLRAFVALLPPGVRAAFEFRHHSWDDPEIHAIVSEGGHALCAAEHEAGAQEVPLVKTGSWGYVRLRDPDYDDDQLRRWVERIAETWDEAFVFFKHEQTGPQLVNRMTAIAQTMDGVES